MGEDLGRSSATDRDPSTVAPPHTRRSVHGCLGGGQVADVLLWKRRSTGAVLLIASSTVWFLFERAGHSLLSLISNVLLLLVIILFFWAKSASLLNRCSPSQCMLWGFGSPLFSPTANERCLMILSKPLPPLPNLEVSEDFIGKVADGARYWINRVLAIAHDIALGRDVKLFVEVVVVLWLVSFIGGLFSFLTLVFIATVLALTLPALYDKYQDHVDEKLRAMHRVLLRGYRKIDDTVLRKLPVPLIKEKKIQ